MSKALTNPEDMTLMRACDGVASWKLSTLRSLYVLSQNTPDEFAARFNLNLDALTKALTEGHWEAERAEYAGGNMAPLIEATRQRLHAMYVNSINQLELLEFQESQQLEQLQRHRAQFGDLFMRDEQGDVKRDVFGQPIALPLIQSPAREKMKAQITANLQGYVVSIKMIAEMSARVNPQQVDPTLLEAGRKQNDAIDEEIFGKRCEECGQRCGGKCGE